MSWVARALPAKSTLRNPSRTIFATSSLAPVWTTAGPSTARIFSPAARVRFIAWAISRTLTALGFSLETALVMNSNSSCFFSAASIGKTRMPVRPTTTRSPALTPAIGTHRAAAPSGSSTMPQSISWSSTSTHSPPRRTWVRKLVVQ